MPPGTPASSLEAARGAPRSSLPLLLHPPLLPPPTHPAYFFGSQVANRGCSPQAPRLHPALHPCIAPLHCTLCTSGEFFLFWNLERSHGLPALACISSGAFAATAWKRMNYKAVVKAALSSLERSYGEQATSLFRRSVVSDWGRNPYARGSYSFVAVGSSGCDYDELARPVGTRLFFAGEHTNGQHPATATGAFLSGLREAQRIDHAARHGFASLPAGQQAPPSQPEEAEARPGA